MSKTRTRFAPSPTGFLHVGGLRTALFNYLYAKQNRGDFVLRIEDTDVKRHVKGAAEKLLNTLKTVGLDYDEGPDLDNNFGPYIQSERLDLYKRYAEELVAKGKAYYCFCSPERLEKLRKKQIAEKKPPMYDRHCLNLSDKEKQELLDKKNPYVVRLKIPQGKTLKFDDLIHNKVEFKTDTIDDQVLLKSDGYPTYHLANVVDDHLMKISHVIRGEEWLPSTPKHILLYQAFDWQIPKFAHLPLLLNKDRSKLSKRQSDVAVEDYLEKGYLPQALLNFVALLGWNPETEEEIFSLQELIKKFKIEQVNKSNAIFDTEKLNWLNGHYIREMDLKQLAEKCIPYLISSGLVEKEGDKYKISETDETVDFDYLISVVALEQERIRRLDEISEKTKYFFLKELQYDSKLLIWKKLKPKEIKNNLQLVLKTLKKIKEKDWKKEELEKISFKAIKDNKKGVGDVLWPMRVALTGLKGSPGPFEVAEVLGKEKSLKRIEQAIEKIT